MKKILYLFIGVLFMMMPLCVDADSAINYIDENGNTQSTTDYKVLEPYITWEGYNVWISVNSGWYIVKGDTLINGIKILGDVKIILLDNSKLTVGGTLAVNSGNKLTIYSQSLDESTMGKLIVKPGDGDCGIGGDDEAGGVVIINGGYISAKGGANGAGIGSSSQYSSAEVTINNGIVYATGGYNGGAGIGTGGYGGKTKSITINGGTVVATGGSGTYSYIGAGIGGGYNCAGGDITINGGTVTATAGNQKYCVMYSSANGIGGGAYKSASNVTINGGSVNAYSNCKAGIGASNIVINEELNVLGDNESVEYTTNYSSALSSKHDITVSVKTDENLTGTITSSTYSYVTLAISIIIVIVVIYEERKFYKNKKKTSEKKVNKSTKKETTKKSVNKTKKTTKKKSTK